MQSSKRAYRRPSPPRGEGTIGLIERELFNKLCLRGIDDAVGVLIQFLKLGATSGELTSGKFAVAVAVQSREPLWCDRICRVVVATHSCGLPRKLYPSKLRLPGSERNLIELRHLRFRNHTVFVGVP